MKFFGEADPKRTTFALAFAFDEAVLEQLFDVVVGPTAAKVHQLRLQDPFFQRHRGQGPQAGGAEVHRKFSPSGISIEQPTAPMTLEGFNTNFIPELFY